MDLLPRDALVKTGDVDLADWNYQGILGYVIRRRYTLLLDLLPNVPVERILEVGYGSGIFLPELAHRCTELHGADVHAHHEEVAAILAERLDVLATLKSAPAERLPYGDGYFDIVIAVSTLEFVADLSAVVSEFERVLKPAGRIIVITPVENLALDLLGSVIARHDVRKDFGDKRAEIVSTLTRELALERLVGFPTTGFPIYKGLSLARKGELPLAVKRSITRSVDVADA